MKHITERQIYLIVSFVYIICTVLSVYEHHETDVIVCWMGFCTFRIIAEMNRR